MQEELQQFLKKKILLDTRSSWVYIGTLEAITSHCAVLAEVDVHDSRDSHTTKEVYALESKVTGIKANRQKVYVNLEYVISFSALDDVIRF
jgi:small nuclear ribonucleoprotein (snRNP)-like protein